jgi:hypothetical protein
MEMANDVRQNGGWAVMVLYISICGTLLGCRTSFSRLSHLVTFEMEDQFQNTYTQEDFLGRVLVVIGGDRKGAPLAKEWGKALGESLQPEISSRKLRLVGLSTLKGVPFFLKGYVRGKFPKTQEEWALLDWQGLFAGSYGFTSGEANILVFDESGNLVHKAHFGQCQTSDVRLITSVIRKAIKDPGALAFTSSFPTGAAFPLPSAQRPVFE